YTTDFIDSTPELFAQVKRRDRATKLLNYLGDVTVNGHPEVRDRPRPTRVLANPEVRYVDRPVEEGTKQLLERLGPEGFARWMREQDRIVITDPTMLDAHQSPLATRTRTYDIARIAQTCAKARPLLIFLECWGGATFGVALRFL